jgi:hypothetical protein
VAVGYLLWRHVREGAGEGRRSRRILRDLDSARETLRRQLTAGLMELADETRIRIADLERAVMQLEGFI